MKILVQYIIFMSSTLILVGQQSYSASFVATLGTDTVIVETYNMVPNHLYGKAFLRYPVDRIGVFNFHFHPDGSIQYYSMSYMKPDSSYVTSSHTEGVSCENGTCTYFSSKWGGHGEYVNEYQVNEMNFMGGWTPTLSLIEWNCMRLIKSGQQVLPITMLNDYIGVRQVALSKGNGNTMIFGGDFLKYAKIKASPDGRIMAYDGTGTPWNYIVTKHEPINVDEMAKRMSIKAKIGIPSPKELVNFGIAEDTISLSYSRPLKRGREIFGGIVPFESIWRTGANDPSTINFPYDVLFGKITVPKGEYCIYTIPRVDGWTLIFNTDFEQWPTEPNRAKDFALVPLQVRNTDHSTEQLTITIDPVKGGGIIKFNWDETEAFAPFSVLRKK